MRTRGPVAKGNGPRNRAVKKARDAPSMGTEPTDKSGGGFSADSSAPQ